MERNCLPPNTALQPTPPQRLTLRDRLAVLAVARLSLAVRPHRISEWETVAIMSIFGLVIIIAIVAIGGLAVGIELFHMVRAIGRRDWAAMRYVGFNVLRFSLFLAGGVFLIAIWPRSSNVPIFLMMAAVLVQIVASWPPLKAFIGERPRQGSA